MCLIRVCWCSGFGGMYTALNSNSCDTHYMVSDVDEPITKDTQVHLGL